MPRALLCCALLVVFAPRTVRAACAAPGEPALAVLSQRALKVAALEPERMSSMMRRARAAALLPHVQAHLGRGNFDYVRNPDTLEPTYTSTDSWRFDVTVSLSLDRLIFDPHEVRVADAAGRVAEHRARLVERVAGLWRARRELDAAAPDAPGAIDHCTELTVLLDAMTGGALLGRVEARPTFSLPPAEPRR